MSSNKDGNDVDALVAHLHLGTVRYREFGTPKSTAASTPAAAANPVAPVPPAAPAPVAAPVVAITPAAAAKAPTPVTVEDDSKGLRSVSGSSPLAFTFERLRRQAIGTPLRKPYLSLNLPERHAWQPGAAPAPRQRLLTTIFAEMEATASARSQKQA